MVTVIFQRSDAVLRKIKDDVPSSYNAGKFDWVQLTYTDLRVSPDGEQLASFDPINDAWYLNLSVDVGPWSDVVIN